MTSPLTFSNCSGDEEAQRLAEILGQCFNPQIDDYWSLYSNTIGLENFRVIRTGDEVAGGLALLDMGQWYEGQCVPMTGIAAVGVPPEYRGTGIAVKLLTYTLKELHTKGVPLSTLYAATQRPYRKVGYEQAGAGCYWELPAASIMLNDRTLPIRSVVPQPEIFHNLHQQWAIKNNGNLARNPIMWQFVLQPPNETIYAYVVGSPAQPEGYIIFSQRSDNNLSIRDWVALTPAAGRRLLTFLSDHRSQIDKVLWWGSPLDPFLLLLPEQTGHARHLDRWLLRVVDVVGALSKRGYPLEVEAELHLAVRDDLLPENNGQFILTVSKGRGEVSRGGRGELQLDIRGLAPLYTGLFTPYQLQLIGHIEASDAALAIATQLFTGSAPWMPDKF
ncbi:MAG: GNAT family N-acetyltransferase [Coleofasciculus sp. S288]|nr:GNAT family N-acetyltransferase [Coleofasciculus sp. S288]